MIVSSLGLGVCKLASIAEYDPVRHVRDTACLLQRETMPADGRIVYRELVGYFPMPPTAVWELETEENWPACEQRIREQLGAEFQVLPGADDILYCVGRGGGEVQRLDIELISEAKPARIRCSLSVAPDLADQ